MGIWVARDLAELQGVLVAVVGNDVNVGRSVGDFGLDAQKAAGDVAAVKCPVHGISPEDRCNLFLWRKSDEGGLEESGTDHRGSIRRRYGDGARRARRQRMRLVGSRKCCSSRECESRADEDEDGWFHG